MESDIYFQVISKLSKYSEKDYGIQQLGDTNSPKLMFRKFLVFIVVIGLIVTISGFIASKNRQASNLIINMYVVEIIASISGVLSHPHFLRKFPIKLAAFILIVSVILSVGIFNPANIISQLGNIHTIPFLVSWFISVSFIAWLTYFVGSNVTGITELSLDVASVFLPLLPVTFGRPIPNLAKGAYDILRRDICTTQTWKEDINYILTACQADLDSAEVRSLPWVVVLGLGVFQGLVSKNILSFSFFMGIILLFIGLLAIFNIARVAYFHTVIIQMGTRLLKEMTLKAETNQNDIKDTDQNIYIYSKVSKPGCLLGLFLPKK